MLGRVKRFIRRKLDNERYPAIHAWYTARDERKRQEAYERHQHMTYAEIEAEIGRTYQAIFGRSVDWDNPKSYNEKMQVAKLYMPTPLKTRLADKYLVREWITEKIGAQYLIPLLGVYDSFDEIDFSGLPDKFVMKCNHDSGSVTLVKDKSTIDIAALKQKYESALAYNFAYMGFEMHYRDIKPKIIIEQYMGDAINDYKFLCFDGKPFYCWVDVGRFGEHRRNIYNMDWELQPFIKGGIKNTEYEYPCPEKFCDMKRIVEILCDSFDQVRVDFYLIEDKIYFGEMTFTGACGFSTFNPDEWDYKLGELWPFDNTVRKKVLAQKIRP